MREGSDLPARPRGGAAWVPGWGSLVSTGRAATMKSNFNLVRSKLDFINFYLDEILSETVSNSAFRQLPSPLSVN